MKISSFILFGFPLKHFFRLAVNFWLFSEDSLKCLFKRVFSNLSFFTYVWTIVIALASHDVSVFVKCCSYFFLLIFSASEMPGWNMSWRKKSPWDRVIQQWLFFLTFSTCRLHFPSTSFTYTCIYMLYFPFFQICI